MLKHNNKREQSQSLIEAELSEMIAKRSSRKQNDAQAATPESSGRHNAAQTGMPESSGRQIDAQAATKESSGKRIDLQTGMPPASQREIDATAAASLTGETESDTPPVTPLTSEEICQNANEEWSKLGINKKLDAQCRDNVEETWLQAKLKGEMPFLTHKQDRLKNYAYTKAFSVRSAEAGDSLSASADLVEFSADYRTFADPTTAAKQWNSADKFHDCQNQSSLEFQLAVASILTFMIAIIFCAAFLCSHSVLFRKIGQMTVDTSELELVYQLDEKWKFRSHH